MVLLLSIPPSLFYLIKILLEAILVLFVLKWRETRTRTQTSIHLSLLFLLLKNYFQALIQMSGANVKDNLLKDIYNLYSLGEKSIDALPENMIRSDTRFCSQEVQTDTCLSNTLFATKSDVEELKNDFLSKLSDLREEFTSVKCPPALWLVLLLNLMMIVLSFLPLKYRRPVC